MKRAIIVLGMVVALVGFMTIGAQAAYITGGISYSGSMAAGSTDLTVSQTLTFSNVSVQGVSGSYSGVPVLTPVTTFNSISYTIPGNTVSVGGSPLWEFTSGSNTYSFTETSAQVTNDSASSVTIHGLGTLAITGYTDTTGSWTFTGNSDSGTFSFSGSNGAVPEPATLLLLGFGLLGLGIVGTRMRKRTA